MFSDNDRVDNAIDDEIIQWDDEDVALETSGDMYASHNFENSDVWKFLIVDDEPDVHQATKLALRNFEFEGKPIVFLSAYSAAESQDLIANVHPDVAVILLDVVMETNDAGFQVVKYIREQLQNKLARIILRTGYPGEAPEESAVLNYDINDYKLKVELTRQRMIVSAITALRSYRDLRTIANQKVKLEETIARLQETQNRLQQYNQSLESAVSQRTATLNTLNQKLHRLANFDALTQIPNRRRFDRYWREQWLHLQDRQEFVSLILIDVDYFKRYNDYYGHQAGDRCLMTVAQAIQKAIDSPLNLVARYGGEEFAAILPNADADKAQEIAHQIAIAVQNLNLPHNASPISSRVTVSMGICSIIPQADLRLSSPISQADRALYQAKTTGRDRYCLYNRSIAATDARPPEKGI